MRNPSKSSIFLKTIAMHGTGRQSPSPRRLPAVSKHEMIEARRMCLVVSFLQGALESAKLCKTRAVSEMNQRESEKHWKWLSPCF